MSTCIPFSCVLPICEIHCYSSDFCPHPNIVVVLKNGNALFSILYSQCFPGLVLSWRKGWRVFPLFWKYIFLLSPSWRDLDDLLSYLCTWSSRGLNRKNNVWTFRSLRERRPEASSPSCSDTRIPFQSIDPPTNNVCVNASQCELRRFPPNAFSPYEHVLPQAVCSCMHQGFHNVLFHVLQNTKEMKRRIMQKRETKYTRDTTDITDTLRDFGQERRDRIGIMASASTTLLKT